MATYRMNDGKVVSTDRATASWSQDTRWNGSNHISVATGSQWSHEKLYRSQTGRYWIESWSNWQGTTPSAEWATCAEAAAWLEANGHEIPADLQKAAAEILD